METGARVDIRRRVRCGAAEGDARDRGSAIFGSLRGAAVARAGGQVCTWRLSSRRAVSPAKRALLLLPLTRRHRRETFAKLDSRPRDRFTFSYTRSVFFFFFWKDFFPKILDWQTSRVREKKSNPRFTYRSIFRPPPRSFVNFRFFRCPLLIP